MDLGSKRLSVNTKIFNLFQMVYMEDLKLECLLSQAEVAEDLGQKEVLNSLISQQLELLARKFNN